MNCSLLKMIAIRIVFLLGCTFAPILTHAQTVSVTNVRFEFDGERIIVSYNLSGPDTYAVSIRFSVDGGNAYTGLTEVSQDVGDGIREGTNKTIIWDIFEEYPDGISSNAFVFDVLAVQMVTRKSRSLYYILAGAVVAGAGGTIALLLGGSSSASVGPDGGTGTPTPDHAMPPARPSLPSN